MINGLIISKKRITLKQQERDVALLQSSKAKESLERKVNEISELNKQVKIFNEQLEEKVKQQTSQLELSFRRIHGCLLI